MRHAIDPYRSNRSDTLVRVDAEASIPKAATAHSLAALFPNARFFAGSDIRFSAVAASASSAEAGDLVIYRVGQDCPSKLIADAMARGAAGILTEQLLPCPLTQCIVGDIELAAAEVTALILGHPDRQLLTVGVIGSAGKTTTALMVASLLRDGGIRTAFLTDLGECDGIVQSTPRQRLPAAESLVQWLGEANDSDCKAAVIELSDDFVRRGQYDAIQFDLLIVTGSASCSQDFGPSGLQCGLERLAPGGAVVAPADDSRAVRIIRDSGARAVTYGVRQAADVTAKLIEESIGITTLVVTHGDTTVAMETPLCGEAMAANHAAAVMVGLLLGKPLHVIVESLGKLRIPGRAQWLTELGHANAIIDAAGSPERAAASLRMTRSSRIGGRLWCVLAIEGDETPEQLARYGSVLERFVDHAIITSVRHSKQRFLAASHGVLDGVERCAAMRLVADHERAVRWAVTEANPKDTILMLGGFSSGTAHDQRHQINEIQSWVASERERQSNADDAPSAPKLSIFK